MKFIPALFEVPCVYLFSGLLISFYQGYRGFMFQWLLGVPKINTTAYRVILLCIAESFTYFVCALSGFYSIILLYFIAHQADPSTSLMIFLALYGLLGITGKLPEILSKLELPKV